MEAPNSKDEPYERPDWFQEHEKKEEPKTEKYEFDIRVYRPVARTEIPVTLPAELYNHNTLVKTGYHTIEVEWTPEQRRAFVDWSWTHQGSIKIIGER